MRIFLAIGQFPHLVASATDRKAIDINARASKRVQLTTRCVNSLAADMHQGAIDDPRFVATCDMPAEPNVDRLLDGKQQRVSSRSLAQNEPKTFRSANFIACAGASLQSDTALAHRKLELGSAKCNAFSRRQLSSATLSPMVLRQ
jgi:hypothetical protein